MLNKTFSKLSSRGKKAKKQKRENRNHYLPSSFHLPHPRTSLNQNRGKILSQEGQEYKHLHIPTSFMHMHEPRRHLIISVEGRRCANLRLIFISTRESSLWFYHEEVAKPRRLIWPHASSKWTRTASQVWPSDLHRESGLCSFWGGDNATGRIYLKTWTRTRFELTTAILTRSSALEANRGGV